jgi:hypothetical protein
MFGRPLTDHELLNALPLIQIQRETIYNDFILAKKYDIKKSFEETPDETKEETKGEEKKQEEKKD